MSRADELRGAKKRDKQELWLALAQDPDDEERDALYDTLALGSLADVVERVAVISKWKDAGVARALAEMVEEPRHRSLDAKDRLWPQVFEEIERRKDPTTIQSLRRSLPPKIVGDTVRVWMEKKIRAVLPVLEEEARRTGYVVPDDEAMAPPKPQKAPARDMEKKLLAAIAEDPFDDGAKQVYADWLLEQGDPRGEFIVLQFRIARGEATKGEKARADALQKKHWREWLGDLAPLAKKDDVHFDKGFLSWISLGKPYVKQSAWDAVAGNPILATVAHLNASQNERAIRAHPIMKSLEWRVVAERAHLLDLAKPAKPNAVIELTIGFEPSVVDIEAIATSESFPRLRVLKLDPAPQDAEGIARAVFAKLAPRLATIDLAARNGEEARFGAWLAPAHAREGLDVTASSEAVTAILQQNGELHVRSTITYGGTDKALTVLRSVESGPYPRIWVEKGSEELVTKGRVAALAAECKRLGAKSVDLPSANA